MRQWLIITMHDERYDFNFQLYSVECKKEDLTSEFLYNEYGIDIVEANFEERNGVLIYKSHDRRAPYGDILEPLAETLEVIYFTTTYLIPMESLNSTGFNGFFDGAFSRNLKFGVLDIKDAKELKVQK